MSLTIDTFVAAAIRYPAVATTLGPALSSDLVNAHPLYRQIMAFVLEFQRNHRKLPNTGDWELWLSSQNGQTGGAREALQRLYAVDLRAYTPEFLANESIGELKNIAAFNAVARLNQAGRSVTPETLRILHEQLRAIEPVALTGLADLRDVERWVLPEATQRMIPTGIDKLDRLIGGWQKELVLVMADSGIGKTTFLINTGQHAMLTGHRVLHITFELSDRRTIHRYYRRITESDQNRLRNEVEMVTDGVKHWLRFSRGQIHVLYHKPYEMTTAQLRNLVDQYAQKYGGVDMIILDYLDLMRPASDQSRLSIYDQLGRMTHEARALTIEFDCDLLSATQAIRRANGARRLTQSDMGDSYNKVRGAGVLLGLVQTEEEFLVHQGRLCILKVRDNPGRGAEIPLYINLDLMLIADLDHPNSRVVMKRFGHLPTERIA